MGGGHVMRCLALAGELAARGGEISFVSARMMPFASEMIRAEGYAFIDLGGDNEALVGEGEGWDRHPAAGDVQRIDAAAAIALAGPIDRWIVDHYRLDEAWQAEVRRTGAAVAVIDDLANRKHDCDVLIDPTLGRAASDYRPLVPEGARILAGAPYAPLRPRFAEARPAALAERVRRPGVHRILVMLGSTDIGSSTAAVLRALEAAGWSGHLDVVLASRTAPSLAFAREAATRHPGWTVHVAPEDIPGLMARADLAIGAAGTSSWERCALGLPTVHLVLAANQELVAKSLSDAGAGWASRSAEDAVAQAMSAVEDGAALDRAVAAAAGVTAGRGARLIADALTGARRERVEVVCATETESLAIWAWRNDPEMRAMAKSADAVPWRDHAAWYARCRVDPDCILLVGRAAGEPAGTVRFDRQKDGAWLVSINVAPEWRGRGAGGSLLAEGCAFVERERGPATLAAEVRPANASSVRIFTRNGFHVMGEQSGFLQLRRAPVGATPDVR